MSVFRRPTPFQIYARRNAERRWIPSATAAGGTQTVFPDGIATAGAVGTPTVVPGSTTVQPTGIATAESVGSVQVNLRIFPDGIGTAEALGSPTVNLVIFPDGIGTAEALGTPTVTIVQTVLPDGIATAETLGDPTLLPGSTTVQPTGIGTAEALGSPQVNLVIFPNGVGTAEALGSPQINLVIFPDGIATGEDLGVPTIDNGTQVVGPEGIYPQDPLFIDVLDGLGNFGFEVDDSGWFTDADETIDRDTTNPGFDTGSLRVTKGSAAFPTVHSNFGDIPLVDHEYYISFFMRSDSGPVQAFFRVDTDDEFSTDVFDIDVDWARYTFGPYAHIGTVFTGFSVGPNVTTPGGFQYWLDQVQLFVVRDRDLGLPHVSVPVPVNPTGIASAESLGDPYITITVSPTGIATAGALGTVSVQQVASPTGIASAGALGTPTLLPGSVTISPTGIPTAEALGSPTTAFVAQPTGIASAQALGSPSILLISNVFPTAINTAETMGLVAVLVNQAMAVPGIPSAQAVGDVRIARTVYVLTAPIEFDMPARQHETALDRVGVPEGVTIYRVGGTWRTGRNLGDLTDIADRVYRGGYDNIVDDATERAQLVAAGFSFEVRTVS